MWVCVIISLMAKHDAVVFEHPNDRWISVENQLSREIRNLVSKTSARVDGHDQFDAFILTNTLVVFAEPWRQVNDTSAIVSRDKICGDYSKRTRLIREIIKSRFVCATN